MKSIKQTKCCHCGKLFIPDARNRSRQKHCFNPACRKASKAASQKKWLSKPENQNYFSGPENVQRVQEWRKRNPGYWRRSAKKRDALQDSLTAQPSENKDDNPQNTGFALQDALIMQPAVLLGLIANITGNALQDDIVNTLRGLQQLGADILKNSPQTKGGNHDCQNTDFITTGTSGTQKLQLDRSPPGQ